jgi:putative endonuclease
MLVLLDRDDKFMGREHVYFVYLIASRSRTLYCGVTNSLRRRTAQHREHAWEGFSSDYNCFRVVWFEQHKYIDGEIAREKQIKRWRRDKKVRLIERENPTWEDLSAMWLGKAGPSTSLRFGRDDNPC